MQNLFLVPTSKKSKLLLNSHTKEIIIVSTYFQDNYRKHQNIYITSDEEIKEGDAYITKHGEICKSHNGSKIILFKTDKKIILTTDQDLITDGVQAIDDEFLEWFVENPKVEYVQVERLEDGKYVDYLVDGSAVEGVYENYKIILSEEESNSIPTAKEFIEMHNRLNDSSTELLMIEFAKLHVKHALIQLQKSKVNYLKSLEIK